MADYAHRWTDWEIANLERRIQEVYEEAAQDVQGKLNKFIRKFKRDDAMFRKQLADGKITKGDYQDWLRGQVFQGEQWRAKLVDLSAMLTRYNQMAADIVNDATPGAFAMNANWAAFQIEKAGNANMGFGLYDAATVKRLIRDEPALMPYNIDVSKDQRWNQKLITGQIEQGIVQGEGIADITKRLQRVAYMNDEQARTHARTCMTAAQNAGRVDTYHRAENMGIQMRKEWLATLDGHTRDAHRWLDGQKMAIDQPFQVFGDKIMYPGDPEVPGYLRYNCRCTLIADIVDWPAENAQRRDNEARENIEGMTFKQWQEWKKQQNQLKNAVGKVIIRAKKTKAQGIPGTITQVESSIGGISRNYYDERGFWIKQITNNDHGNPKKHPYGEHGEHAHDIIWEDGRIVGRPMRELTERERKEEADIL